MGTQNRRLPRRPWISEYPPLTPDTALSRTSTTVRSTVRSIAAAFIACFTPPPLHKPVSTLSSRNVSASTPGRAVKSNSYTCGDAEFSIEEICKATRNFSPCLKIGQGGYGTVYQGTLDDGSVVAIKRAKKGAYDDHKNTEFHREIETLTQVEHLNLVQMYGFLEEGGERILVVEYVPNGTLRDHSDGNRGDVILEFSSRLDIAIDVAHAMTYLHTYTDHPIIHRDIKSSNILLTNRRRAKVADFGFARMAVDRGSDATHVSTQVKGTAGYLDPEYIKTYQLTDKSDVYSFGALLVELVSGRRAIESKRDPSERITAKWAIKKLMEGDATWVLDPRLERNSANEWAIEKILELALQCLAPKRDGRPSMKRYAEILWSIRKEYRELAAFSHSTNSGVTPQSKAACVFSGSTDSQNSVAVSSLLSDT